MSKFMRGLAVSLVAGTVALAPLTASAMGSSSDDDKPKKASGSYDRGVAAVKAQNWDQAISQLKSAVKEDPSNADAYNYLGYSLRKSGDPSSAINSYKQALRLNADHKGAHEYIGQAYLEMGDMANAKVHLSRLDEICFFGCAEYTSLKNAINAKTGS